MAYRSNTYYCEANVNNIFTLDYIIYINYQVFTFHSLFKSIQCI